MGYLLWWIEVRRRRNRDDTPGAEEILLLEYTTSGC